MCDEMSMKYSNEEFSAIDAVCFGGRGLTSFDCC